MSHLTTIDTEVNDLEALSKALASFGLTLGEGGKVRYYSGPSAESADHVIKLPGKYDLGLVRRPDGTYAFMGDSELLHAGSFGRNDAGRVLLGDNLDLLRQAYSVSRLDLFSQKQGYTMTRHTRADGTIHVSLNRG